MKQFEYKTEKKSCEHQFVRYSNEEDTYLKDKGEEGWELVSVIDDKPSTVYYWKKEKNNYTY